MDELEELLAGFYDWARNEDNAPFDLSVAVEWYEKFKSREAAQLQAAKAETLQNLGFDRRLDNPILWCGGEKPMPLDEYIATLNPSKDKENK